MQGSKVATPIAVLLINSLTIFENHLVLVARGG